VLYAPKTKLLEIQAVFPYCGVKNRILWVNPYNLEALDSVFHKCNIHLNTFGSLSKLFVSCMLFLISTNIYISHYRLSAVTYINIISILASVVAGKQNKDVFFILSGNETIYSVDW
jgi:hypothetical protein